MRFRPCIDIHNGKVKQIVGGSLTDEGERADENYISSRGADYYAELYRKDGLTGGHIILLNPRKTACYEEDLKEAKKALKVFPGGMQVGGGIGADNAGSFLEAGASHVIVTSYVFQDGKIRWDSLEKLKKAVGKKHIVIDLSCRKKEEEYYIVTDRWQKFTVERLTKELLEKVSSYCDEFLVHGVDVEGRASGIDEKLAEILGEYKGNPVTYAGGISSISDLEKFRSLTGGEIDYTIGSALDLFGGEISYEEIKCYR